MTIVGRATLVAGLALSMVASSCSSPAPSPSPSASGRSQAGATHIALIEAEDAQTLDPALIDDPTSLAIGSEIFEGLTRLDANQRPVAGLADHWEIANGGKTYTFHLRRARYQSGNAVQAQDAVAAWTHALAPDTHSPNTIFFAPIGAHYPGDPLAGVQVVDASTVRLQLPQPDSELLTLLALPPYWINDPKQSASGSGPYHLDRWDHGRARHPSAFSSYWGLKPSVRSVDIEIEPDNTKRLDRFASGAADVAHGFTGPQLLAFARDPQHAAELHKVASTRTTWLGFNTVAGSGYGPTDRQAIAQAIDRARLTDLALYGSMLAVPATDLLPPGVPGHINRQLPAYDPAAARTALDQASFPASIDLYFSTSSTEGRVANDLQDQIGTATGRTVNLHPTGDFFNQAALDKLPFFIDTWSADIPFPSDFLENVIRANSQFNNLRLFDTQIERALNQGRTALTWDDALKAYQQADTIAISQNWLIPLYHGVEPYLVRPGLRVPFVSGTIAYRWEDVR
ncbi:MAG: ABC transporter substrate-binding protein [Chloroflexi bacterium]|nr:MAG: ABC transporter substrate-binding protein [Chloroflexota bacterium]